MLMVCVCGTRAMICTKVRGQLCGTASPFSPVCVLCSSNSGLQVVRIVQQASLLTESNCWSQACNTGLILAGW